MDRDGMPSALPRLPANRAVDFRRWPIAAAALVVCVCAAPELGAQTVIGGTSPDVQVDLGVLDSLGPEPTLPELLRRQLPTGKTHLAAPGASHRSNTVSLHAPRVAAKKKHTVAAHAPSKKPKSKAAAHAVAAVKPAAPIVPAPSPPPTAVVATPIPPAAEAAAPPQTPATTAPPAAQPLPGPRVATAAATAAGITPAAPAPADAALAPAAAMSSVPAASGPSRPMLGVTPAAAPAAVAAGAMPNRIIFAAGAADLPDAARNGLDALAQRLTANPQTRLQLVAHASGAPEEANQARRISLSRALAVRSYLIEHGVPNSRMDVRALGNRNDNGGPSDRVDIVLLDR